MQPLLDRLATVLRAADKPLPGGLRGYVADPDDHVWEVALNPAWPISTDGRLTFGLQNMSP